MEQLLERFIFRPGTVYATPAVIEEAPAPGPFSMSFWRDYLDRRIPFGRNTVAYVDAPGGPTRRDPYGTHNYQLSGDYVVGQAPTQGIYTGVEEEIWP